MKKTLKAGVCFGLIVAALFAYCPNNALAVDDESKNVTIGDVEEAIYSVDVSWGSMVFDYLYSEAMGWNYFMYETECKVHEGYDAMADIARELNSLFYDSNCQTPATDAASGLHNNDTFYIAEKSGRIIVEDRSTNGAIDASVEFTPSNDYPWIIGDFYKSYSITMGGGAGSAEPLTRAGYLDTIDRFRVGELKLSYDATLSRTRIVEADDVVGTVTITISPR